MNPSLPSLSSVCSIIHSIKPIVSVANGTKVPVLGSGQVNLFSGCPSSNALFVPSFPTQLLSVGRITNSLNCNVIFSPTAVTFQDRTSGKKIGEGVYSHGLYLFQPSSTACHTSSQLESNVLHQRLGHPSKRVLSSLFPSLCIESTTCDVCQFAKQSRLPFAPNETGNLPQGEESLSDLIPLPTTSIDFVGTKEGEPEQEQNNSTETEPVLAQTEPEQSNIAPDNTVRRRSSRESHPPLRMKDFFTYHATSYPIHAHVTYDKVSCAHAAFLSALSSVKEPTTFEEANSEPIRHATKRSDEERDDHFNPINLDYIFDEDDPLAEWLQEEEHAILDDVDNSEWLDTGDAQNPQNVDLSENSSSGGRGLSSSSSGSADDDGPNGWETQDNIVNRTTYHEEDGGIRNSTQQQRHSISSGDGGLNRIRRSRPISDIYTNHYLRVQFGQLEVGQDHGRAHHWQQRPIYPYYTPQDQQSYFNQPDPPFMGIGYPHRSHQHSYSGSSSYGSNPTFREPSTHGYSQQQSDNSGTTNNFEHCNFTNNFYGYPFGAVGQNSHGDDQFNEEYVDPLVPPRHSFWH
ncbi:hypothetical protein RHSIM_Rhsim02G0208900 [Rhododendron simsii]|uniref:GAG-pre-integrase domain-containing protein n=1 Tax=Rhododendron simsii TaxID=118357 RepID=A0A834LY05_RHOSS|nr:hypothetical protein RHSIM_Rhsim02G0208900 [Rhododendron simsii]